jgi:PPM family protein phosphatase
MSGFPGEDRPVVLSVWGITDVGRSRSENQDAFLIVELSGRDETSPPFRLEPGSRVDPGAPPVIAVGERGLLLLVADGMGGAAGGATASRMAAEGIADTLRNRWNEERMRTPNQFVARIREAVEETNTRVHRRATASPELFGMGTTATVAGILDGIVYLAQVGDSRGYLVRDGRAVQLTRDQSMVQELVESGALTVEEAERSPHRSVLLQALGTSAHVDVALTWHELRRGDRLVLCSDGLSGPLSDADIAATVSAAPSPDRACEELVRLANERGGPDNITAVVARVEGGGVSAPGPGEEARMRAFAPGSA